MKKLLIALIVSFLFPCLSVAAEHAVRAPADCAEDGDGTAWCCKGSGGSCTGNVGARDGIPATLTRGDTYYLGGGTYPGYKADDTESSTSVITIKRATEAAHGPATGWDNSFDDSVVTFSCDMFYGPTQPCGIWITKGYFTIDGVTGGGPGSWTTGHGIRVVLDNAYADARGIIIGDTSTALAGISLSHIEIDGNIADPVCNTTGGINFKAVTTDVWDGYYLGYNYVHHCGGMLLYSAYENTNLTIEYNRFDVNESCAAGHASAFRIDCTTSSDIRYNWFSNIVGTGWITMYAGCAVTRGATESGQGTNIYGNLFSCDNSAARCGGVIISGQTSGGEPHWSGVQVYNNTFYNLNSAGTDDATQNVQEIAHLQAYGSDNYFKNNLLYGFLNTETSTRTFPGFTLDYNATDYNLSGDSNDQYDLTAGSFVSLDSTNANFMKLSAGTTAGVTLASPFTQDCLADDSNCVTRGADGTWDRGAYEYSTGTIPPSATGCTMSGGSFR